MKSVAIIPARCGSKGIPLKNLYLIDDRPLISYAINAVKKSNIDEIYVSTDCMEISDYVSSLDIKVIKRPSAISTDSSPTIDSIYHAIDTLSLKDNDIVLTVQATSPLIIPDDINQALKILLTHDFVVSVCEHHKILWHLKGNNIFPYNHDPLNRIRRQEQEVIVSETGSIYGSIVQNIKQYKTLCGTNNIGYVNIPKDRSFEIDDYEDINIVEKLIRNK